MSEKIIESPNVDPNSMKRKLEQQQQEEQRKKEEGARAVEENKRKVQEAKERKKREDEEYQKQKERQKEEARSTAVEAIRKAQAEAQGHSAKPVFAEDGGKSLEELEKSRKEKEAKEEFLKKAQSKFEGEQEQNSVKASPQTGVNLKERAAKFNQQ